MRILVTCELPTATLEQLRSLASDVGYRPGITAPELRNNVADVGVLIVGNTRVSPEIIDHAESLQVIVRAGPGPGNVALEEASAQGIFITHCPDMHASAVAELTFGLILALDRRIVENTLALREGRWNRAEFTDARGLAGRTIGILGYGPVGRLVARRALAFDMHVVAWSPLSPATTPTSEPEIEFCNWPRELARRSDIVTVHASADDELETLIDAEFLQSMPPGAYLVHVGHPGAADEAALAEAIEERNLRVALDVFSSAPTGDQAHFRCQLCNLPGVIATQHIGPLTEQARRATADEIVRIVRAYLVSGEVLNCLNLAEHSPATWQLVLRIRDQVGVMASILGAVRADGINAEEITSRVFTGAKASCCTIALDERPSTEALDAIRSLPDVLHLELRAVV
ncbi:MAG: hydroxyacid dehydrogenase [Phycisphaerae bacterium]|nr:hydroxyacid dehydrogenase [Phycisphaerae bacterium]